jgi:hypothetical protein
LSHVGINISCNGSKSVVNCIMGFCAFFAMGVMRDMDTHRAMGCVHTHWGILIIEGCGSPNHVQNVVEKIGEDNQKVGKISWSLNQVLALGLEHDKIRAWWVLDVLLKSMLKRV